MTPFQKAVLLEIAANLSSIIPLLIAPDFALSFLLKSPSQITPATLTLAQYFGCMVTTITIPLLLSLPSPSPGPAGEAQRGTRRTTYLTLASGEVFLGGLMGWLWISGSESGMTDMALLGGAVTLGGILGVRYFFLFARPEFLEGRGGSGKKTA